MNDFNLAQSLITLTKEGRGKLLLWYLKRGGTNLAGIDAVFSAGVDPKIMEFDGHGLLAYASTWPVAERLIKRWHVDVRLRGPLGRMAQHLQAYYGRAEICEGLVENGANIWEHDDNGQDMLRWAQSGFDIAGRPKTIECITELQRRYPDCSTTAVDTVLESARAVPARFEPTMVGGFFEDVVSLDAFVLANYHHAMDNAVPCSPT